ncbi:MAG: PAS domain S-box protein, partial [Chloroflexi bacterium]
MVLPPRPFRSLVVDKQPGASSAVGPRALAALHELAVAASGVLEPTALAKLAVDLACDLLGVDGAALYWFVSSTGLLHSLADNRGYQANASRTLEVGKGVAGLAFQRQEPLIIDDYPKWEGAVPWALEHGVRAGVGIPLMARGRIVGAMAVLTHAVGGFDADDLRLLSLLAAQVAPSLEAGRLDIDLAASEQRFRSLYGSVASGVIVLSASGVIIQINPAGERIIGLSAEEMRGKTPDQLWHRERWVLIDAIPVMGPDGQALQVVSSFLDITERKQVEGALRESEERFRAVFNRAAIGIARIDLAGRIIEANPALQRMLGYSAEELTHNPLATFVHPDYVREGKLAQLTELSEGNRHELQQELRYVHKLGGLVWCNSIASLV